MSGSAIFHAFHVTLRESGQSSGSSHGELPLPFTKCCRRKITLLGRLIRLKISGFPLQLGSQHSYSVLCFPAHFFILYSTGIVSKHLYYQNSIFLLFHFFKKRPCVLLGIENGSHLNRNLSILTTIIRNYPNLDPTLPPSFFTRKEVSLFC